MSSTGVMHARQFEPIKWIPLDAQEAHGYPASYEEARRHVLRELLSMPAAPPEESKPVAVPRDSVADIPNFGLNRDRERAGKSATIKGNPA
jgi:hypothetical protein